MAVHNDNDNDSTENKTDGEKTTTSSIFGNMTFGGSAYGVRASSSSAQTELLNELVKDCLETDAKSLQENWGVNVQVHIIKSGQSGGVNPLICDAVAISLKKDGKAVISSIILANPDEDIKPLPISPVNSNIYRGLTDIKIVRTMRDLDSPVYRGYVLSTTADRLGLTKESVSVLRSIPVDGNLVKGTDGKITHPGINIRATIGRLIQSLSIKLGIEVLGEWNDISVKDIKEQGGMVTLDVSECNGTCKTTDGVLIAPKLKMTFGIRSEQDNMNTFRDDPHNGQAQSNIAVVQMGTEVHHIQAQAQNNQGSTLNNASPVYMKTWKPCLVIDQMELPAQPTHGIMNVIISIISGFTTPDIVMSMFDSDIGSLNVISNIMGVKKPAVLTKKFVRDNFREVYSNLFADGYALGMRIRTGTVNFVTDVDWLELATNPTDNSPIVKAFQTFLFDEGSTERITPSSILVPHIEVVPTGYYMDNGTQRPLSDFDIRKLYELEPGETDMHREWLSACTSRIPREERLAIKTRIIMDATNGSAVITGTDHIVYFRNSIFNAIAKKMIANGIKLIPTSSVAPAFRDLSWEIHGASQTGFAFSDMVAAPVQTYNGGNGGGGAKQGNSPYSW